MALKRISIATFCCSSPTRRNLEEVFKPSTRSIRVLLVVCAQFAPGVQIQTISSELDRDTMSLSHRRAKPDRGTSREGRGPIEKKGKVEKR